MTAEPRFSATKDGAVPFDSQEFEAGYSARLAREPECMSATHGWRAGRVDADGSLRRAETRRAS